MPLALNRLLPPGAPATAAQIVDALGLAEPSSPAPRDREGASGSSIPSPPAPPVSPPPPSAPARPRVLLNMVSTVDGRATIGGRSGPIGNSADRELFHALRTVVDAVVVGAGTARAEHYGRLVREPAARELRRTRGLAEEPLACIVSGRLALTGDIPLLADRQARVAILTPSDASLAVADGADVADGKDVADRADIAYVRAKRADGRLDLPGCLAQLRERFAVRTLMCEGGPHLNGQLLAAGLVDELFLSFAPKLAGGDAMGEALRIVTGVDLDPPVELELLSVVENGSHLFLRYAVRPPAPAPAARQAPAA